MTSSFPSIVSNRYNVRILITFPLLASQKGMPHYSHCHYHRIISLTWQHRTSLPILDISPTKPTHTFPPLSPPLEVSSTWRDMIRRCTFLLDLQRHSMMRYWRFIMGWRGTALRWNFVLWVPAVSVVLLKWIYHDWRSISSPKLEGATHSEFIWLDRDEISTMGWSWDILTTDFERLWERAA